MSRFQKFELLLGLLMGCVFATLHWLLLQPAHFESILIPFAIGGLAVCMNKWIVMCARQAHLENTWIASVSLWAVWTMFVATMATELLVFRHPITISGCIVMGLTTAYFILPRLQFTDAQFEHHFGFVPSSDRTKPTLPYSVILCLALVLPMLNFLTYLNMGLLVLLLPMLMMSQKLQKQFYQHHSMWFDLACLGIYAGIWGYGTGYMNTI